MSLLGSRQKATLIAPDLPGANLAAVCSSGYARDPTSVDPAKKVALGAEYYEG